MESSKLKIVKVVENSNMVLGIRKPYQELNFKSRTVLTDDMFSYVDFFFKKHKRILIGADGKEIKQSYMFYWKQAEHFYRASKLLPAEAAPLTMYYCMLNAAKAYILYASKDTVKAMEALKSHGLHENIQNGSEKISLSDIYIERDDKGVFRFFSVMLDDKFETMWPKKGEGCVSIKSLLEVLPFVHSAYISTYSIKRNDELFLPLPAGVIPSFYYCSDKKIHMVIKLQKSYFKQNATSIPSSIEAQIPDGFDVCENAPFSLISERTYRKSEINAEYSECRKMFSFISAERRLWYLNKRVNNMYLEINKMSISFAVMHRFSEIVRYKPEQMDVLLNGKENWLIREFILLALDQFIDEISCLITKQEIMQSRIK